MIDQALLTQARANAVEAVARAEELRADLKEVDITCLRWYDEISRIISDGKGQAADYRAALDDIDWDYDAMRAVRG